jgi:hypothetical protein
MDIYFDIANYLQIPNEKITIDKIIGNLCFFRTSAGAKYSCKLTKNGKHISKNSIRVD